MSNKPYDIPEQVWDEAGRRARGYVKDGQNSQEHFARAILAERLRCAIIADEVADSFKGEREEYGAQRVAERIRGDE